ncbi:MAG: lysophospholipase [Deltaproteobacteria bacterium]|nr:lysophospholipase [Deltaproteobacteria bacterium]
MRPDVAPLAGSTAEEFVARDGTHLYMRHWPAVGDERGVLVIMHGLKDYSARYAAFAGELTARGYSVWAFDLRGHGQSAGPRVAPRNWTDYVDDLDRFLAKVEKAEPGKPIFLFGHSMGGAIAARTAEVHEPALAGLVLSGPALAIDAPPLLLAATRMSGALMPQFPALKLDNHSFSSDPAAGAAMDRDPLVSQPPAPAKTAAGLVDGIGWIWMELPKLQMPLLALHGTADKLTAPAGSRMFIEQASARDKTLRIYPGLYHDLVHEPAGKQVRDDILAWLDAHTGGPAVPAPPIYAGTLAGDPRGWTQAVELAGGVSRNLDNQSLHFGGDLAVSIARPRPLGVHVALTARWADKHYAIDARPLGAAVRLGSTMIGLSVGVSLLSGVSSMKLGYAAGLWIEQPLGIAHLGVRADYEHAFDTIERNAGWLVGTLRFGSDRTYWPHTRAGVGPIITGGYECAFADICSTVILGGIELYGVD